MSPIDFAALELDATVAQISKLGVSAQTKIESWATTESNKVKLKTTFDLAPAYWELTCWFNRVSSQLLR